MPKRIQMSRQRPWRAEHPDAVIVDRTTAWGNPFKVDAETTIQRYPSLRSMPVLDGVVKPRDRAEAVRLFRYIFLDPRPFSTPGVVLDVEAVQTELAGKDLACWCPLDQPCHADVLLELANGAS